MVQWSQQDLDNIETFKRVHQNQIDHAKKVQDDHSRYWAEQKRRAHRAGAKGPNVKTKGGSHLGGYLGTGFLVSIWFMALNSFFSGDEKAGASFMIGMILAIPIYAWTPLLKSFLCAFAVMFVFAIFFGLAGLDGHEVFPVASLSVFPMMVFFLIFMLHRAGRKARSADNQQSSAPE